MTGVLVGRMAILGRILKQSEKLEATIHRS